MGCAGCPPIELTLIFHEIQEGPPTAIELDAFAIESHEVTVGEYHACVEAGACTEIDILGKSWIPACTSDPRAHRVNMKEMPIDCMSIQQAESFCAWLGRRLPTEAEWEKAARGTDGRKYPWGSAEPTCELAHFEGCEPPPAAIGHGLSNATHIGTHPKGASPYGVEDMAGNVYELVQDVHFYRYFDKLTETGKKNPVMTDPGGKPSESTRTAKGGGYRSSPEAMRTTLRVPSFAPAVAVGFRCALSIPEDVEVIEPTPEERRKTSVLPVHPEMQ